MSMVEVLNELRKIRGKFLKDEGIYVFSRPEVYVAVPEQRVSTTPVYTDVIDFTNHGGGRLFFVYNKEDVPVYVEFLTSPYPDLADEDFVSIKTLRVDPNAARVGIMRDGHLYMKLKLYAESAPSTGSTTAFVVRWGV